MTKVAAYFMTHSAFIAGNDKIGYERDEVKRAERILAAIIQKQYVYVAAVEAEDLDDAWVKTNSIDEPWYNSSDVSDFRGMVECDGRARSAMVGDLYVMDGKIYIVAMAGFNEVPASEEIIKVLDDLFFYPK